MVDVTAKHEADEKLARVPCSRCGTLGGKAYGKGRSGRTTGARFGLPDAVFCHQCYEWHARQAAVMHPCASCGDAGGFARTPGGRPMRFAGATPGAASKVCHACFVSRADPAASRMFARAEERAALTGRSIRLEALAILSELAARGDEIEDRRVAEFERGPIDRVSARVGARQAVEEYDSTIFGKGARP